MSLPPFELTVDEFSLCSVNMKMVNNNIVLAVALIDTYAKTIRVTQFVDTTFFTSLESLLKQEIPQHEDTKYYIYVNTNNNQYKNKIENIIKDLGCVDDSIVEINNKMFSAKVDNLWTNLKTLFNDED